MSYNNSHFDNDINLAASYRRSNPPPSSHQSYSPLPGASSPFNHLSQVEHQSPGSIHPDSGERDSPHFSRLPLDPIPSSPYYPRTSSDWNSQTVGNGTWHSADCNDVPARRFESSSRGRKVDRRNSSCSRNRSSSTVPYGYNNRKLQSITSSATSSHRRYRLDRHGRSNGRTSTCDRRKDVRTFRGRPKSHWRQKRIPRRSRSDSSISSSSLYDFSADSESKKRLLGSIDHRRLQPIDVIRKSKKLTLESRSSNSRTSSNVDLKSISCRRKRFRKRESNNNQLDTEFSTQSLESVLPEIIEPTKVAAGTVIQSVASGCQPTTTDSSIGHSVTKNHSISLTSDINHSSNSKDEMQITLRIPDESIMAQLSWRLISNSDSNDVNIKEDLRSIRKEGNFFII